MNTLRDPEGREFVKGAQVLRVPLDEIVAYKTLQMKVSRLRTLRIWKSIGRGMSVAIVGGVILVILGQETVQAFLGIMLLGLLIGLTGMVLSPQERLASNEAAATWRTMIQKHYPGIDPAEVELGEGWQWSKFLLQSEVKNHSPS